MKKFIKRLLGLTAAAAVALAGGAAFGAEADVPVVYFTKDISPAGLLKIYDKISADINGQGRRQAPHRRTERPNLLPLPMAKALVAHIPNSNIVETKRLLLKPAPDDRGTP